MCKVETTSTYHPSRMRSEQKTMSGQPQQLQQNKRSAARFSTQSQGRKAWLSRMDQQNNNADSSSATNVGRKSPMHNKNQERFTNLQRHVKQDSQNNNGLKRGGGHSHSPKASKRNWHHTEQANGMGSCTGVRHATNTPSKTPQHTASRSPPPTSTPSKQFSAKFAGAKFSDPPSPKVLPKPPIHWFGGWKEEKIEPAANPCFEMTNVLKVMLNVQA